jgi:Zn-dependent protease
VFGPAPQGAALRFTLFGFPVAIAPSFLLVAVLLGVNDGATVALVATWVAVVVVSMLVHELGHATVARRLGGVPRIDLYGLGGLTTTQLPRELRRTESLTLSLAGPFFGFALGGALIAVRLLVGDTDSRELDFALAAGLWANFGWGLVNLLPVLPLDGGNVLAQLLPGSHRTRYRRAAIASVVTASAAAVALLAFGLFIGAVLFGMLVATNITTVRNHQRDGDIGDAIAALERVRAGDPAAPGQLLELARGTRERVDAQSMLGALIADLVLAGRAEEAERFLADPLAPPEPSLHALVAVGRSGGGHGLVDLTEMAEREPTVHVAYHLVLAAVVAGRSDIARDTVDRLPALRHPDILPAAVRAAERAGRPDLAAALQAASTR